MDEYLYSRIRYQNISGNAAVAAGDTGSVTLASGVASYTIYVQRIRAYVLTDAAQSVLFQDTNGTPKILSRIPTSPGVDMPFVWDFGPQGVPCTEAKDFRLTLSGAGLALHVEWEGYLKQTAAKSN